MTSIPFYVDDLPLLKGKTLLITGAASGIGRETARVAYQNGADLVLADWNYKSMLELVEQLSAEPTETTRVIFRKTDVANFDDVLEIFQYAWKTFGVIDAVISNAGVNTGEGLFDDDIDPNLGKLKAPSLQSININLIGHIHTVKCAEHYFRKWPERKCQIVLTGSAASFLDTPPLYMYCAAKAGVLGLMRGIRTQLVKRNITINMVAPWLTITPMLPPSLLSIWKDLPANQPANVAHALLLPVLQPDLNGKSLFVAGNKIIEFEDKLHETQALWMGKQLSDDIDEGQRRLIP